MDQYHLAIQKINEGYYQEAIDLLTELGDYQDSLTYIEDANNWIDFEDAKRLCDLEKYDMARDIFVKLATAEGFEGAECAKKYVIEIDAIKDEIEREQQALEQEQKEIEAKKKLYGEAIQYYRDENYVQALSAFRILGDYEDSSELAEMCNRAVKILMLSTTLSAGINASAGVTEAKEVAFSGETVLTPSDVEGWSDIISISVMGSLVIGLKIDGTVVVGGEVSGYRIDTSTWDDIIAVATGDLYVVGLRENGTLVAQGHNGDGQVNVSEWNNIVSIASGWRHTVGLDANGNVHITGISSEIQMQEISKNKKAWSDIIAISAGGSTTSGYGDSGHTVALRRDGTVVAVGDNDQGQCNVDSEKWPEWTNIVSISAGAFHTVGLRADGTVVTTQTGEVDPEDKEIFEEISKWEDIVAVAAGYGFTLGLKSDGSVVSVGYYLDGQRNTDDWDKVVYREEWNLISTDIIS